MTHFRSHLALASVLLAVSSLVLGLVVANGGLPGMKASCGDFGLRCLGQGVLAVAAGCVLGLLAAIASFGHGPGWLAWLGTVLNGLPLAAVALFALMVANR